MSSFYVFYIFAAVSVLVQCQEYNHMESEKIHEHLDLICDDVTKKEIMANRRAEEPQALERYVVLKPKEGYEMRPSSVLVKRCIGVCAARWSPMPTKTQPKPFHVHLHPKGNPSRLKCVSVEVQEHVNCSCQCMRTRDQCNEKQQWDESNCNCWCMHRDTDKHKCEAKKGMAWDDEDCSCYCIRRINGCPTGHTT